MLTRDRWREREMMKRKVHGRTRDRVKIIRFSPGVIGVLTRYSSAFSAGTQIFYIAPL